MTTVESCWLGRFKLLLQPPCIAVAFIRADSLVQVGSVCMHECDGHVHGKQFGCVADVSLKVATSSVGCHELFV